MTWPPAPKRASKKAKGVASFPPAESAGVALKKRACRARGDFDDETLALLRHRLRRQLGKVPPAEYDDSDDESLKHWAMADNIVRKMSSAMASKQTICARLMAEFEGGPLYTEDVLERFHGIALTLGGQDVEQKANEAAMQLLEERDPGIVKEFLRALHPPFRAAVRAEPAKSPPADVTPQVGDCWPDPEMARANLERIEALRAKIGG